MTSTSKYEVIPDDSDADLYGLWTEQMMYINSCKFIGWAIIPEISILKKIPSFFMTLLQKLFPRLFPHMYTLTGHKTVLIPIYVEKVEALRVGSNPLYSMGASKDKLINLFSSLGTSTLNSTQLYDPEGYTALPHPNVLFANDMGLSLSQCDKSFRHPAAHFLL